MLSSVKKREPLLFKASLVMRTVPTPSLEELPTLLKASLGFVHFTVGNEL